MSVDVADKMANADVISILFKRRIAKPTNNILFTLSGTNQAYRLASSESLSHVEHSNITGMKLNRPASPLQQHTFVSKYGPCR